MSVSDEVTNAVQEILTIPWDERKGNVVPTTDSVVMKNGSVSVDATYLFADLANSTKLAQKVNKRVAARAIRAYLNAASRVIKNKGGEIRGFDGDRVMAVYMGESKNTNAMKTALGINWAFWQVIRPKLLEQWSDLKNYWVPDHAVGVATGEALIVRGGVRNSNDLISVGGAPNIAAKLSDIRAEPKLFVTSDVYFSANDSVKVSGKGEAMWRKYPDQVIGGTSVSVYSSTWWSKP